MRLFNCILTFLMLLNFSLGPKHDDLIYLKKTPLLFLFSFFSLLSVYDPLLLVRSDHLVLPSANNLPGTSSYSSPSLLLVHFLRPISTFTPRGGSAKQGFRFFLFPPPLFFAVI